MRAFGRGALAILAGSMAAMVAIFAIEALGHLANPVPAGLDPSDPEQMARIVEAMPAGAFAWLLAGWGLGTALGAWVTARIAARRKFGHGMIVGALFLAAGLAELFSLPHPTWVRAAGALVFLPAAYLGASLATRTPGEPKPLAVPEVA